MSNDKMSGKDVVSTKTTTDLILLSYLGLLSGTGV